MGVQVAHWKRGIQRARRRLLWNNVGQRQRQREESSRRSGKQKKAKGRAERTPDDSATALDDAINRSPPLIPIRSKYRNQTKNSTAKSSNPQTHFPVRTQLA